VKKIKKLEELVFNNESEERNYLLSVVFNDIDYGEDDFSIEDLRVMYNEIQSTQDLNEKYSKNSIYWSDEQEEAISLYIFSDNVLEKNKIFEQKLYKPFKKLIENIIFTYKLYRTDVDAKELEYDCLSFLITKIDKFDTTSGTRAFSYFGTIAKHYLMGEKKVIHKNNLSNADVDDNHNEIIKNEDYIYVPDKENNQDKNIFIFESIIKSLEEELNNEKISNNDKKVIEAIVYIFKNHNMLDVYNRNLIYHLIKERTGMQGKEITYSLGRLKKYYKLFKDDIVNKKN
jgi:hypothetical protein